MADYMKIPEVAQLLGLSEKTVRRRVKAGEIPSVFIGGVYRISRAGLDEYLELARVRPGKASAPASSQPPLNGFDEERRAEWDAAVASARQLREHGQARMEALLSSWRSSRDRRALHEMGQLLQEAHDARSTLQKNASVPTMDRIPLDRIPIPEWEEIAAADGLYESLISKVLEAGDLRVHRERKLDREVHGVEEAA